MESLAVFALLIGLLGPSSASRAGEPTESSDAAAVVELFYEIQGRTVDPDQRSIDLAAGAALLDEGYADFRLTDAIKQWAGSDAAGPTSTFAGSIPAFVRGLGSPEALRADDNALAALAAEGPDDVAYRDEGNGGIQTNRWMFGFGAAAAVAGGVLLVARRPWEASIPFGVGSLLMSSGGLVGTIGHTARGEAYARAGFQRVRGPAAVSWIMVSVQLCASVIGARFRSTAQAFCLHAGAMVLEVANLLVVRALWRVKLDAAERSGRAASRMPRLIPLVAVVREAPDAAGLVMVGVGTRI